MTREEKKKLIEAIRFLATDAEEGDGFHDGMEILFKLAGLDTSYFEILKELKPMSATEFVKTLKGSEG